MSDVKIHFTELYNDEKKALDESCVKKALRAYRAEGIDLEKRGKVLFFFTFNSRAIRYPNELGALISRYSPEYEDFKREYSLEIDKLTDFSLFDYVVYLSKRLGEDDSEISEFLTISHELWHVVQDQRIENCLLKDIVLKKYLKLKSEHSNEVYRNLPAEYDAFRESKGMAARVYSESRVEQLIDNKICECRDRLIKTHWNSIGLKEWIWQLTYWEHLKSISIRRNFDFIKEFTNIWQAYYPSIEGERNKIIRKCDELLSEFESDMLRAFDFLTKSRGY